jgi:ribosome-associated heat shock protein Hsp15
MDDTPVSQRLDVWLDVACIFKTRSAAQKAIRSGQVDVNGEPAKAHRMVKVGDRVVVHRAGQRDRIVVVLAWSDQNLSKAAARLLYDDLTPPPTPEEIESRRIDRLLRAAAPAPTRRPHRRDRAALRRVRGRT